MSTIPVTVNPHATLKSPKVDISCGELPNEKEEISEELKCQGVTQMRHITIRRDSQLLNTKHLILNFDSNKLPENLKAGYMRLSVRTYIPNSLRCSNVSGFRKLLAAGHRVEPALQKSDMKMPIAPVQRSVLTTRGNTLRFLGTVLPGNRREK
ncbi:hypothetical protein AVEN_204761-1 [Araneus ventricosus]|uniref:Uncharacterized protein n=1 Tax=Araneus ventricosus TaxID=182803 RepID=A0A4Y2FWW6_ARAVE|nr:hypothetical protein AVEN_204761-1 [Araneus ventricosus]